MWRKQAWWGKYDRGFQRIVTYLKATVISGKIYLPSYRIVKMIGKSIFFCAGGGWGDNGNLPIFALIVRLKTLLQISIKKMIDRA